MKVEEFNKIIDETGKTIFYNHMQKNKVYKCIYSYCPPYKEIIYGLDKKTKTFIFRLDDFNFDDDEIFYKSILFENGKYNLESTSEIMMNGHLFYEATENQEQLLESIENGTFNFDV